MDRLCKTTTFLSTYFHLSLFLVQILTYSALTNGKSVRIDMRTDPSVHPCLDTFDILMTTPNITEDKYIRLIRVYTSNHMQRYYTNTLKLDYVREFRLPLNNYLKLDCHLFDADYRYYCFVFVALSQTTGAVLINSRPHCRPTTMQLIVTSSTSIPFEDNTINSLNADRQYVERLRPAGPSYKYNNYPTKPIANNIYGNSRRVSSGGVPPPNVLNDINKIEDNLFNEEDIEDNGHYINIDCKCSNSYDIDSNVSRIVISLGLIMCDRNNNFKNQNQNHILEKSNNNIYDFSDRDVGLETTGAIQSSNSVLSHSESHLIDKNYMKNPPKNKRYLSDTRDSTDLKSDSTDSADSDSNYPEILSTICVLNLMESNYKMKVQYENWRNIPVIYVSTTAHTPHLVVREGRLAIDPQLDINNKSQIHSLRSQYLRIESFYAQNLTLKLILLKTNNKFLFEKYSTFRVFLSSLTPIHYTSMALIVLFVICLMALFLISITSPQRKTIVKIVTPSEEGDQTHTSYMEQTDIVSHSQFSLADDNQSLEMDYYDYLLPFVPRPQSRATTHLE